MGSGGAVTAHAEYPTSILIDSQTKKASLRSLFYTKKMGHAQ